VHPEWERIALQIQAIVAPYGPYDESVQDDVWARAEYRLRAGPLLDALDLAARPFPDLQARLSAVRLELNL
jgi:hypothetical protein